MSETPKKQDQAGPGPEGDPNLTPKPDLSRRTQNEDGSTIVRLSTPVRFGSEEIRELRFRPAKGKDLRRMPIEPSFDDLLKLAERLSGQPPTVIDDLDFRDALEVAFLLGEWFDLSLATGPPS